VRNAAIFRLLFSVVFLTGDRLGGHGSASARNCCAQALFSQVAAIRIHLVEAGDLASEYLFNGFSLADHYESDVDARIVWATGPGREFAAHEPYDLLLEASGIAGYFFSEITSQT